MFKDSLRDLDLLLVPLKRKFVYGQYSDLMSQHKTMKEFLRLGQSKAGKDKWFAATSKSWDEVHDDISEALGSVSTKGAGARRAELVTNGVLGIFAESYVTHALPPSVETTDLRDIGSAAYASRMNSYVEDIVDRVNATLQLTAETQEEGSWRAQMASKLRFLASPRGGFPARPFFCLDYLLHIHREFCRTPDAIKEVCTYHLRIISLTGSRWFNRWLPTVAKCLISTEVGAPRLPRIRAGRYLDI